MWEQPVNQLVGDSAPPTRRPREANWDINPCEGGPCGRGGPGVHLKGPGWWSWFPGGVMADLISRPVLTLRRSRTASSPRLLPRSRHHPPLQRSERGRRRRGDRKTLSSRPQRRGNAKPVRSPAHFGRPDLLQTFPGVCCHGDATR